MANVPLGRTKCIETISFAVGVWGPDVAPVVKRIIGFQSNHRFRFAIPLPAEQASEAVFDRFVRDAGGMRNCGLKAFPPRYRKSRIASIAAAPPIPMEIPSATELSCGLIRISVLLLPRVWRSSS